MSPSSSSGWACASWIFRGDHTHGSGRSERAVAPRDRRVDGLGRKADARRPRGKRPADFRHAFERELKVRPRNADQPMVSQFEAPLPTVLGHSASQLEWLFLTLSRSEEFGVGL